MSRLKKILQSSNKTKILNANDVNHIEIAKDVSVKPALSAKLPPDVNTSPRAIAPDLRTLRDPSRYAESVDKTLDALGMETAQRAEDLIDATLTETVFCAKTGRELFKPNADGELLYLYAQMENSLDADKHGLAVFTQSIAPHFVNTSPEQLDKLRVVDPCGLYVYLSAQLIGKNGVSFAKTQGKGGFAHKIEHIHERYESFTTLSKNMNDEKRLKIALANDFMLKILAITSFRNLFRSKFAIKQEFNVLWIAARDLDAWGAWCKNTFVAISELLVSGKSDITDVGIERKASLMGGNTSMRTVVVMSATQKKRQWLDKLGIGLVVHNALLESLTADELLMPAIQNGAWPIDKLRDPEVKKRVHNAIVIKSAGKAGKLKSASERTKNKLQRTVEVMDFLDMADIKGTR